MPGKPKVMQHKCLACGVCIEECPANAIIMSKKTGKAYILSKKCENCGLCISSCPVKAIKRK